MIEAEAILKAIESMKTEHAHHALTRTSGTEFEYGRATGSYLALSQVVERINAMLEEDAQREQEEEKRL